MYNNVEYKHVDVEEEHISLHDCYATSLKIKDNMLSAELGDGFWVSDKHACNKLGKTVKTDASCVNFHIRDFQFDEISIYLFKKNWLKQKVRVEIPLDSFVKSVNEGKYELEFLYQYLGYNSRIIECCVHSDKKPYHYECQLYIPAHEVSYCWNNLCDYKVW